MIRKRGIPLGEEISRTISDNLAIREFFGLAPRKDGWTVKKLIAIALLAGFLVTIGVGCGGTPAPTSKAGTGSAPPGTSAPKEKDK
jgi:hypothetical protein